MNGSKKAELKTGDVVMIFEDALKLTKPEGLAVLRAPIDRKFMGGRAEFWMVEFKDAPDHWYERIISKEVQPVGLGS